MNISVYVHIPFCQQKCRYCDFVSFAGKESFHEPYIAALCREIASRGGIFADKGIKVSTVFVGGGTPTCLSSVLLTKLFASIKNNLQLTPDAEVSMEANPGTVDERKLAVLREVGVNRLSLGVQAFDDVLLQTIGRIHRSSEAEQAIRLARQAGFTNLNIDLMHGLPGQTLEMYRDSLHAAVKLGVEHISAYSLILEEDTPLAVLLEQGVIHLPEEEEDANMFELTQDILTTKGYEHYEISNYARPGKTCRHNLAYWHYQQYAGFGVAACSFENGVRLTNTTDISCYLEAINGNRSPIMERETLSLEMMMAEYTFMALRTMEGVSAQDFMTTFSRDFHAYYKNTLTNLIKSGLLRETRLGVQLTRQGIRFGNQVFAAFLPD